MKIDVLGTKYTIKTHKVSEDIILRDNRFAGYCNEDTKEIVIADMTEEMFFPSMSDAEFDIYRKRTLRHEITHAFLNESGLSACSSVPSEGWAKHEEMVDWIAIQFPKMKEVFEKVGCLC